MHIDTLITLDILNHSIIIARIKELYLEVSPLRCLISFFTDSTSSFKNIPPPRPILQFSIKHHSSSSDS